LYLPLAVGVHFSLESKPLNEPDLPAGQSLHPLSLEMPLALLYLPSVQLTQLLAIDV
jgi:hypothetical protein